MKKINHLVILSIISIFLVSCSSVSNDSQHKPSLEERAAGAFIDYLSNPNLKLEDCQNTRDPSSCRQIVAVRTGDHTICETISYNKENCYEAVGIEIQNPDVCNYYTREKLNDEDQSDYDMDIEYSIAHCRNLVEMQLVKDTTSKTKSGSIEECENLLDQSTMLAGQCYMQYATRNMDYTACQRIAEDYQKNMCLSQIAIATRDTSICDEINVAIQVEQCKSMIR